MASPNKKFISNSQDSVRMFRSDFLEALSKVHFTVPLYVYVPVIIYCLFQSVQVPVGIWKYPVIVFCAILTWTIVEYVMHRFVFHYRLPGKIGERLHFVVHGVHHDYPSDRMRLVMPPSLSIPLALGFFYLFRSLMPEAYLWPFFATFLVGYLVYDIGHYAMHHYNFKSGVFKKIKHHHMKHHYQQPEKGFGVSSPLWDALFKSGFNRK